jgi:hypothetical protein
MRPPWSTPAARAERARARERSAGERGGQGGAVCVGGEGEGAAGSNELAREVLKAADMLQAVHLLSLVHQGRECTCGIHSEYDCKSACV